MSRWILRGSPVLLVVLVSTVLAAAPDWPQFRGPNRDDISTEKGLLKQWPSDGPPVVWKATGVGSGFSTVSVVGDKVFTLGNKGNLTHVFALDRATGMLLWSAEVGRAGGNLGCTPTVDGDRLYAVGQQGDLVCLAVADGKLIWKKNFKTDFGGNCGGWSYTESPLVDGEKLVCTPGAKDATLVALNKKTGEVIWKSAVPSREVTAGYSSIVIAEVGGIRQYVQLIAGGVVGVAAKDGKFLWKYEKFSSNTANIPTPIVLGDHIFCAAGYGKGGALLHLVPTGDGIEARELYYSHDLKNKHGGLVVIGDHVYGDHDDSGTPFCAELKTGKVVWRRKVREPGRGSAAVTYADGHLYFRFDNGYMALVPATPTEYREVSTFKIPNSKSHSWAHPVVVDGKLYLREQDMLWCHDVRQK